jgi:hypothetical protein
LLHDGDLVEAGLVHHRVKAKRGDQAMIDETITGKPRPKGRKFSKMGMTRRRPPDIVLENRDALLQPMGIL